MHKQIFEISSCKPISSILIKQRIFSNRCGILCNAAMFQQTQLVGNQVEPSGQVCDCFLDFEEYAFKYTASFEYQLEIIGNATDAAILKFSQNSLIRAFEGDVCSFR